MDASRAATLDDMFMLLNPRDVSLSPSGSRALFSASKTFREKGKQIESGIFVVDVKERKVVRRIWREGHRLFSPCFRSDSAVVYADASDEGMFLVIEDTEKGLAEEVRFRGEIESVLCSGGEVFLIGRPEDVEKKRREKEGDDAYFFEEEEVGRRLYRYVAGTGFVEVGRGLNIWEASLSGGEVYAVASDCPHEWCWYSSKLYRLDGDEWRMAYNPGWRQIAMPAAWPGGVAFVESLWSDRGVTAGDILVLDRSSGKVRNVTEGSGGSHSSPVWGKQGELFCVSQYEDEFALEQVLPERRVIWKSHGTVLPAFAPSVSLVSGKFAFAFETHSEPPEVYVLERGRLTRVSEINSALRGLQEIRCEKVEWEGEDGLSIYGLLRYRERSDPLIVLVHGGPTSSSKDTFLDMSRLYISRGFSVFLPNYRGSTGKGREYAEANLGDMGGMDFRDIVRGVEKVLSMGFADREHVYITGGSYGGFMTAWAVTQTDMFRAAVGLFGISDWVSFHGVSNLPLWDRIHYNQDPYEFDRFVKFSPLYHAARVKTPVLLMHGVEDPYVPVGQYMQFYRALREMGKEVRLLLFPREGHGFREKEHRKREFEETVEWFKSHS